VLLLWQVCYATQQVIGVVPLKPIVAGKQHTGYITPYDYRSELSLALSAEPNQMYSSSQHYRTYIWLQELSVPVQLHAASLLNCLLLEMARQLSEPSCWNPEHSDLVSLADL